ncbi:hypothetical protein GWK47_043478 [Chionoecetes opilio]|uniref:Uncharacterized protein n=1 Tax=Chionoecetes opilio TaxID=41210 RepID=A0A8J5CYL9_CHIOP|nr:hypothetical protein GWK47_043478 [Chionoecetes opilio]
MWGTRARQVSAAREAKGFGVVRPLQPAHPLGPAVEECQDGSPGPPRTARRPPHPTRGGGEIMGFSPGGSSAQLPPRNATSQQLHKTPSGVREREGKPDWGPPLHSRKVVGEEKRGRHSSGTTA